MADIRAREQTIAGYIACKGERLWALGTRGEHGTKPPFLLPTLVSQITGHWKALTNQPTASILHGAMSEARGSLCQLGIAH